MRPKQRKKKYNGRGDDLRDERVAMSHEKMEGRPNGKYVIMFDSGATSHITLFSNSLSSTIQTDMSFTLADNSQMQATHSGVRKV